MANKALFQSRPIVAKAQTKNRAGGKAYKYSERHELAQLAVTGCLNQTYYMNAAEQFDELYYAALAVEPEFLAKTAIYARKHGHMKDTPALLLAVLATLSPELLSRAFPRVIDNGKMLRNFVQIIRSGAVGRKSLGTRPKKLVQGWLNAASDELLLRASVGQSPSLADVIKMVHPKPTSENRAAFYSWLIGKPCDVNLLPDLVKNYLAFRERPKGMSVPDVPFQMLTSLPLTTKQWARVAERGGWQMVRMNLNTFQRHGVFEYRNVVRNVARRLADKDAIAKARVFPYQLLAAWKNIDAGVPQDIRDALAEAMEIAIDNVPILRGQVAICPDVSGSMLSPVTGERPGSTSKMTYIDVASLVAAAILRKNPDARMMPFDTAVRSISLPRWARVVENAEKLAKFNGGGTACSAPLVQLNREKAEVDMVILISDNQSWVDQSRYYSGTSFMEQWVTLKRRCPDAKLVCLDIAPYATTPAYERPDILNIGGFSDSVFDLIAAFSKDRLGPDHWVGEIEKIRF